MTRLPTDIRALRFYKDTELEYAAGARCKCGAGLAQPLNHEDALALRAWVCSALLRGEVAGSEHDVFPFACWKIREETSINNRERITTRPAGTVARTVGRAKCGACGHEWESQPYDACGASHHWFPGACPQCANDCGGHGSWSSADKRPRIDARYRTVVLPSTE